MDNRRLILLLVFSFSLIMLWDAWQKQGLPKGAAPATTATAPAAGPAGAVPTPTLPVAGSAGVPAAIPASVAVSAPGLASIKVKTDLYVADISSQGGDITRLELASYPDTENKSKNFILFDSGEKHIYLAQSGLIELRSDDDLVATAAATTAGGRCERQRDRKDGGRGEAPERR